MLISSVAAYVDIGSPADDCICIACRLGAAYDATHPLTVAAAALSNFTVSSGGGSGSTHPAALMLRDRDMLEVLYKLAVRRSPPLIAFPIRILYVGTHCVGQL